MSDGCCTTRAPIREELEKTIARLNDVRFGISSILDDLDGPAAQSVGEPIPDRSPMHTGDVGLHGLRNQLSELNHVISRLEDERHRLALVRQTIMGIEAEASEKGPTECFQSREIRPGNWGSHP